MCWGGGVVVLNEVWCCSQSWMSDLPACMDVDLGECRDAIGEDVWGLLADVKGGELWMECVQK